MTTGMVPLDEAELAWSREVTATLRDLQAQVRAKLDTVTADNAGRLTEAQRYAGLAIGLLQQAIPAIGTLAQVLAQGGGA